MNKHNTFLCNPHIDECECPEEDKDQMWCNPYSVVDYCPTEGEGDECKADPSSLVRVPVAGGFTYELRKGETP